MSYLRAILLSLCLALAPAPACGCIDTHPARTANATALSALALFDPPAISDTNSATLSPLQPFNLSTPK